MVIVKIQDIVRTSDYLYYMNEFSATAVYNILGSKQTGCISFKVENTATGKNNITVRFIDKVDYPVLQLQMEAKQLINELIETNALPL